VWQDEENWYSLHAATLVTSRGVFYSPSLFNVQKPFLRLSSEERGVDVYLLPHNTKKAVIRGSKKTPHKTNTSSMRR
jgi:hypothetical protein